MKQVIGLLSLLVLGVGIIFAQGGDEAIVVEAEAVYPEGIAYDGEVFYVSSVSQGVIHTVDAEGNVGVFAEDDNLVSTIGLFADVEHGRLLVANSDPGVGVNSSEETAGQLAAVAIYDLESGEQLDYVNLGEQLPELPHFANDLTVDEDGNIYVTDSMANAIFQINPEGEASVFVADESFSGEGINLNGIVYHPDGYLLVSKYSEGIIFKVPVNDPTAFSEVELGAPVIGADGLVLTDDGELYVVMNAIGTEDTTTRVQLLSSDDDWTSASVVDEYLIEDVGTTGTLVDGQLYVVFGQMHLLFDPTNETPAETFQIMRIAE